jgi:hypothetical protein
LGLGRVGQRACGVLCVGGNGEGQHQ